jgi:hypothetical protein
MPTPRRALALAFFAFLALVPTASASRTQESMFQDDDLLAYQGAATSATTLDTLAALGVDRVRVTVKWSVVAPNAGSYSRPTFNASDPNAYPAGAWNRYDELVRLARAKGMKVDFNVSAPAPLWATGKRVSAASQPEVYSPMAADFGAFVAAVGKRYSGTFVPARQAIPVPGRVASESARAAATGPQVPRVSFWSIWNEPNVSMWLTPQWLKVKGTWTPRSSVLYRQYVESGTRSLRTTGHAKDTIVAGELAARGLPGKGTTRALKPLAFIRQMYCVDSNIRPLKGKAAAALGCPTKGNTRDLPKRFPGLFTISGWAHHPYSLILAPNVKSSDKDYVTLADLSRLSSTLDKIFKKYGKRKRLPLWLTEYGYQTNPPDPYQPYSASTQGAFLNQADWMTFRNPRVRSMTQFLLDDDPPRAGVGMDKWGTFQSGLRTSAGTPKASYAMYRLPMYLPKKSAKKGRRLGIWGLVRPAANGAALAVRLEFRAKGTTAWKKVKTVGFRSPRGQFTTTLKVTKTGDVRFGWGSSASRAVRVTAK